jgi:hypothetical protein
MFTTAVKVAIVEALNDAFDALGPRADSTTKDLSPNSVTIEYPLQEVQWPAVYVQFRPSTIKWSGLHPDEYTTVSGVTISGSSAIQVTRTGYYEGSIDLQILAMHSEERDRLLDGLYNLVLMNSNSPASKAFYDSLHDNDLIGITILQDTLTTMGDSVSSGTPFSPEELTYEAAIRIQCVGDYYETKYDYQLPSVTQVTTSGTQIINQTL